MTRYVALLQGINLGAKRRLPMPRLRETLEDAGYGDVRTLLQSGNAVLTSTAPPAALEHDLAVRLRDAFGFDIAVVVRPRDELAEVIAGEPFGGEANDPAAGLPRLCPDVPDCALTYPAAVPGGCRAPCTPILASLRPR